MANSDASAEEIRSTRGYKAAVWSVRLCGATFLLWAALVLLTRMSNLVFFLFHSVALLLTAPALVFLRRLNARYVRTGVPRQRYREIERQAIRDVFWLPRR